MNLKKYLDREFENGLRSLGALDAPAVVKQASKASFGHYQANGVMGAAKKRKSNPRELAQSLLDLIEESKELTGVAEYEIAGPGFINITLTRAFIQTELDRNAQDSRLGIPLETARKILIDYSSPNLAKEMHIGHLRSTAIGDANVRILEFLGHEVVRANHVGDWGAQFGSLLAYMDKLEQTGEALATELKDLEVFYQKASELFKTDEIFADRARQFVVRLQSGDAKCVDLWERFIKESIRHCQAIYDLLDISLTAEDVRAESAYNDVLASTIEKLEAKGLVEISDGAKCVFMDEFTGKDDKPLPAIVQKSDGGYPYMATDLAAAEYRGHTLRVDEALYFVDGRQSLHLSQLYAIARAAGFIQENQVFNHIPFGTILNKEGKPFKTRDGGAVKLADVGDEAIERALKLVSDKNPDLTEEDRNHIARVVGIGAIKYAELSKNRTTDYIFDWDTMLSFEGNTAPYLQYAYTRIMSIFRRAKLNSGDINSPFNLREQAEIALATRLLQYPEAVESVVEDYQANILCNYLFDLSQHFMTFYESCPVLKADDEVRDSRLRLCDLSAKTLKHGLALLGIQTVEHM
ncbi:MAG: arginine--tRNA ligase [Gammaproteobacteria bacterium]|nr:arginine--tRNA ligase [Gammaproteobacteria bacterium]